MGRATKQQAAENRARVVATAARLFQQRGLAVGIAEIMTEAGLTHGGFYRQFGSKDRLASEACTSSLETAAKIWRATLADVPAASLRAIVDGYLHGGDHTCSLPALAGEIRREPAGGPVRTAFTQGVRELGAVLEAAAGFPADTEDPDATAARPRALTALAAMVGAVAIANAIDDETLAAEIMHAVRTTA